MKEQSKKKSLSIPKMMKAWVLDDPEQLRLVEKPVPEPGPAEVLIRIDAVAICGTDVEIITKGLPAWIEGGLPFNKNFTPGHEYMGTVAKLGAGVDEYAVGDRVAVEIHAGCGRCERCRMGMYTSCLNYGLNYGEHNKGHRANGFTTDGGFAEYAVNHINTLVHVPDEMSDAEATLIVTAGTAMYGLDVLGGLIAGESLVVTGPGPIGLMSVAVGKDPGGGARHPDGNPGREAEPGKETGRGSRSQHPERRCGRGGKTDHRREGRPLRDGMLGCAQCAQRSHGHGKPGRSDLSRGIPRAAGGCRSGQTGAQQYLRLRHQGRRQ